MFNYFKRKKVKKELHKALGELLEVEKKYIVNRSEWTETFKAQQRKVMNLMVLLHTI